MTGRERARWLLGGTGHPRAQVDSPWTPEEVGELTGQTWRWLNVGPGRWLQMYANMRFPDLVPRWEPVDESDPLAHPDWQEMMGSRHGRWLVLWLIRHPEVSRALRSIPFVAFTQPEFSRAGAERVWQDLRRLGITAAALQSDNPSVEFLISPASSTANDRALERLGFQPPFPLLREGIQAPEYPEKGKYWGAYNVLITKMMLDALDQQAQRGQS